jgi:hypothetical protein
VDWSSQLYEKAKDAGFPERLLSQLRASPVSDAVLQYNEFMHSTVGVHSAFEAHPFGTSFEPGTPYGEAIASATYEVTLRVCQDLYDSVFTETTPGALLEFGVSGGYWLGRMLDHMDATRNTCDTWGFDSFEGLPAPHPEYDGDWWKEGQYAAALGDVERRLGAARRMHLRLVKGWFRDSLKAYPACTVESVSFAHIDCDLYESTKPCLEYLATRLADQSVLVFDDWTHASNSGETKAFMEWVPSVPHLAFAWIGFINSRVFLRVRHR